MFLKQFCLSLYGIVVSDYRQLRYDYLAERESLRLLGRLSSGPENRAKIESSSMAILELGKKRSESNKIKSRSVY